jgi:hypothetical protein
LELRYEEENQDRLWNDESEGESEPEDPEYAQLRREDLLNEEW